MSKWKPFLLYDGEYRGEREEREEIWDQGTGYQCAFSISTFLRPVSDISLSGPERMTNDFSCFVAIESERWHGYQWGLWPHNNTLSTSTNYRDKKEGWWEAALQRINHLEIKHKNNNWCYFMWNMHPVCHLQKTQFLIDHEKFTITDTKHIVISHTLLFGE